MLAVTSLVVSVFPGSLTRTLWSMALTPHSELGRAFIFRVVFSPGTAEVGENSTDTYHTERRLKVEQTPSDVSRRRFGSYSSRPR